ncbi:right-handed parallel beta-helix repeat-containing protein, partial [Candidatus Pacearchaeota archaeon]|nr:right-handed parallel beta-helix repeat-containing protein [Candidatus Pacearchaeota archaeon]
HEQAWETIAKVNSFSFNTGDCVYFLCGDTWNTTTDALFRPDWSGTDVNNRAVIGAYYVDGSETVGVNVDGRPGFDGNWNTGYEFQRIIEPYDAQYLSIQDLKLYNSYAYGIHGSSSAPCSNLTFRRLEIDNTGRAGIYLNWTTGNYSIVEYSDIGKHNLRYPTSLGTWDAGITLESENAIIRYNEIHEGKGEGVVINSNDGLVENNLVWATRSVGLYLVGMTDGIVRNNVILGNTDPTYHLATLGGRSWNGAGLGFNAEASHNNTLRNKVYNNVVAGCSRGIQSLNKAQITVGTANRNFVYNNTFIDNYYNMWTDSAAADKMDTEYKNNISYLTAEGVAQGCHHVFYHANVGATDVYRPLGTFWSGTPEHSQWTHASDVIGDPKFARTSGWLSISNPNDIDIAASIALLTGSDAINSALNLGDTYDQAFIEGCDFNTPDASDESTLIIVVT